MRAGNRVQVWKQHICQSTHASLKEHLAVDVEGKNHSAWGTLFFQVMSKNQKQYRSNMLEKILIFKLFQTVFLYLLVWFLLKSSLFSAPLWDFIAPINLSGTWATVNMTENATAQLVVETEMGSLQHVCDSKIIDIQKWLVNGKQWKHMETNCTIYGIFMRTTRLKLWPKLN